MVSSYSSQHRSGRILYLFSLRLLKKWGLSSHVGCLFVLSSKFWLRVERSQKTCKRLQCEQEGLHGKGFLRMLTAGKINLKLSHPSSHKIRICKKLSTVVILFILFLKYSTASDCNVTTICRLDVSLIMLMFIFTKSRWGLFYQEFCQLSC